LRRSAEAERAVGVDWYVTEGAPCHAKVKTRPEDFVVEERLSLPDMVTEPREGYLPVYRVEKRALDTMHMARELSNALRGRVSYAGLKDKRAVAVQYATPTSGRSRRPAKVETEKFTAAVVGYVPRPLGRASLVGNSFFVVLRECCAEAEVRANEALQAAREGRIPNFYGLQRFGSSGPGTHRIGRAMVTGGFMDAVRTILDIEGDPELEGAFGAGDFGSLSRMLPKERDIELAVARELVRHPGDWVKALRAVPVNLRRLFVQAYQSYIFNRTMSLAVERGEDISRFVPGDNWAESPGGLVVSPPRGVRDPPTRDAIPMAQLVGYAFRDYGSRFDSCAVEVLEDEGVRPGQFYLEGMQEASQEGGFRRPSLVVRDESVVAEGGSVSLRFTLAKGEYATILLREIVKPDDPASAGLS
jgi:tRNA pseudouridine13 synthase